MRIVRIHSLNEKYYYLQMRIVIKIEKYNKNLIERVLTLGRIFWRSMEYLFGGTVRCLMTQERFTDIYHKNDLNPLKR